ncbi:hypothetical protein ACIQ4I_17465 [Rummeliibacillus sp. NPDC094406]|uniref:hypothetical protein n=1 Tax=Rummeliibacillus sp. NPDC094406 TaxID=3364511 RepID=UPI0037FCEB85
MNLKIISGVLVTITSILAVFFVIKQNFNLAVLFISLMFTITNTFRAKDMARQGYEKEAKWMKAMATFFGIATLVVLVMIIF